MDSTIVIKVKYAETLRRFNANVVDGELDLDMDGLREKIIGLFKFTPDAELTLTYADEDNDTVTIGDDEDLLDVVKQGLNPLRITVKSNTERSGKTYSRSNGTSTPLRSPEAQQPLQNINSNVVDIFKSVPEPILKSITKICADVASTGTSTAPSISEVVRSFAECGLPCLKLLSEFQSGPASSDTTAQGAPQGNPTGPATTPQSRAPGSTTNQTPSHDADFSKVNEASSDVLANERSQRQSSKSNEVFPNMKSEVTPIIEEITSSSDTVGSKGSAAQIPGLESLKAALDSVNVCDPLEELVLGALGPKPTTPSQIDAGKKKEAEKSSECIPGGKSVNPSSMGDTTGFNSVSRNKKVAIVFDDKKGADKHNVSKVPKLVNLNAFPLPFIPAEAKWCNLDSQPVDASAGVKNVFASNLGNSSGPNLVPGPTDECPFTGVPVGNSPAVSPLFPPLFPFLLPRWNQGPDSQPVDASAGVKNVFGSGLGNSSGPNLIPSPTDECPYTGMPVGNGPNVASLFPYAQPRRNRGHRDVSGIVFHRGVCCDGCGVHPISGPRYKSKVREDYDLCSICFSQMGNESDYIRMERPVTYRHPFPFKGLYDVPDPANPSSRPHVFRGFGVKPVRPKLDSCFVQDVNILDGTLMAPLISFNKIWRMRNNGSVAWPKGTQLVWIGGSRLSNAFSVELEIAATGLSVDQELDVAVDFTAPDRPGQYISYWRMASPSGQKFGQRVWVLIQVDASSKELPSECFSGFNLNLPPVTNGALGPEIINVNQEPDVEDALSLLSELAKLNSTTELVEPIVDVVPKAEQEMNSPINDSLMFTDVSNTVPTVPSSSASSPIIDISEGASAPSPVTFGQTSAQDVREHAEIEETLLKDLEGMGFKQVDLNKEILRLNEYDFEKSVDDLCGVSEWDPILEELHEMGFCDEEMNKKLLKKNNGSIKRVVLDLLAKEM